MLCESVVFGLHFSALARGPRADIAIALGFELLHIKNL